MGRRKTYPINCKFDALADSTGENPYRVFRHSVTDHRGTVTLVGEWKVEQVGIYGMRCVNVDYRNNSAPLIEYCGVHEDTYYLESDLFHTEREAKAEAKARNLKVESDARYAEEQATKLREYAESVRRQQEGAARNGKRK